MPPVQCLVGSATGWTVVDAPADPVTMLPAEFACRVCDCREYIAIGQSRKGAAFYSCAGCSRLFTDPVKAGRPAHELVTPSLAHLSPQRTDYGRK